MFRHHRLPLPLPLRIFVLAMFALGLVSQPVFASFGDLHAMAHGATGADAAMTHADHAGHSDNANEDLIAAGKSDPAPAGTLHFLMHHAHCCGQSAMAALSGIYIAPTAPGDSCPVLAESQRLPQAPLFGPFRPPIPA